MGFVVHFKVEIATKLLKRFTRFDSGDEFTVNKKLWFVLKRSRGKLFDPKGGTFVHPNNHI